MKLKFGAADREIPQGTIAPQVSGRLKEFIPGITDVDEAPFHQLKLEGDDRNYNFYGGGWLELQPGTPVTLHSFRGFDQGHDDLGNDYYLDGIEIKDETGEVIARIRIEIEMVFED